MLYLVTGEVTEPYPLPPEEWLELAAQHLEYLLDLKKKGKVVLHGGYVGRQAGCIIFDADSNEELQTLISRQPLWPFMWWEITPLISTERALEGVKEALKMLRG